jgi:hypothetical protein
MLKFKHDEEQIHKALCLPDEVKDSVREKIFFSTFSNTLVKDELLDDEDETPVELTTVTGILEKALGLASEQEYEYMLLTFNNTHDLANKGVMHYKMLNAKSESKEEKTKMKLFELLAGLKELDFVEESAEFRSLTPSNLVKRVKMVKKSNYNFEKYMEMLSNITE